MSESRLALIAQLISMALLIGVFVQAREVRAAQRSEVKPMSSTWTQYDEEYTLHTPEEEDEGIPSLTARHLERVRLAKIAITQAHNQ